MQIPHYARQLLPVWELNAPGQLLGPTGKCSHLSIGWSDVPSWYQATAIFFSDNGWVRPLLPWQQSLGRCRHGDHHDTGRGSPRWSENVLRVLPGLRPGATLFAKFSGFVSC
jgi:hypothetical protein